MNWTQKYIGIPYSNMNCADLALAIQLEVFNRKLGKYKMSSAKNIFSFSQDIKANLYDFMNKEIEQPYDGCAILMRCRNRISHIGTFAKIKSVNYVLHTSDVFKSSILTPISCLKALHIEIEGFYQWK